jgi:Zn-dependent M28 family amino/carboxypeptidase
VGKGQSTLEDTLTQLAAARGRTVQSDQGPKKGHYFRSDHFELAKVGGPAISCGSGWDYIGRPADWGMKKHQDYGAHDDHKPSNVVKPAWISRARVEDLRLLLDLGYSVAQGHDISHWKTGSEFKARRDAMMRASR